MQARIEFVTGKNVKYRKKRTFVHEPPTLYNLKKNPPLVAFLDSLCLTIEELAKNSLIDSLLLNNSNLPRKELDGLFSADRHRPANSLESSSFCAFLRCEKKAGARHLCKSHNQTFLRRLHPSARTFLLSKREIHNFESIKICKDIDDNKDDDDDDDDDDDVQAKRAKTSLFSNKH